MLVDLLTPSDIEYHDSSTRSEALLRAAADALVHARYMASKACAKLREMEAHQNQPAARPPPEPLDAPGHPFLQSWAEVLDSMWAHVMNSTGAQDWIQ